MASDRRPRILFGLSASVACIQARAILSRLGEFADVRVVVTCNAVRFLTGDAALPASATVLDDADEWKSYEKRGDPVLHIELRKWADLLVIAPISANTLAKIANGMADNLLTCIARAWQMKAKPFIVAPAMNTGMWEHAVTASHVDQLRAWEVEIVPPVAKTLICGDYGLGAMATVDSIVEAVHASLRQAGLLSSPKRRRLIRPDNVLK
ncbi:Flavoprotein domain-containing protein [Plasmodiophora brassicae]